MEQSIEQLIRERAYGLWEKEGSPHGRQDEFWERARLMIEAGDAPDLATPLQQRRADERSEDAALEETFPASDAPSFTRPRGRKSKVKSGG